MNKKTLPRLPPICTIGHSTRTLTELIALLEAYGIKRLVDVRTIPRSRTNPQFNRDTFPVKLECADIRYLHLSQLGGLRHSRKGSLNTGWRILSFRVSRITWGLRSAGKDSKLFYRSPVGIEPRSYVRRQSFRGAIVPSLRTP